MNKVVICGRAVKDAAVRYTQDQMCIARFNIAVDRRGKKQDGKPTADFPSCVAFGKTAEFCEKWVKKGVKFDIAGHLTTGSYQDKDGKTVYTTEVTVDDIEFGESKGSQEAPKQDQWMDVPDDDDTLPFN